MAFRDDVRRKVLACSRAAQFDSAALFHVAPTYPDELDDAVLDLAARVLKGAQFMAFCLRYAEKEWDAGGKERVARAWEVSLSRTDPAIVRNSNRAVERLLDILSKQTAGTSYRGGIIQAWKDAKENTQRRNG